MDVSALDDRRLAVLAQAGDSAAAGELFNRYWPRAWRAAYGILGERSAADDAAQSAIERAFAALGSFDVSRPFGPWITRIAANQALNELRSRRRSEPLEDLTEPAIAPFAEIGERDELFAALGGLSLDRRVVVVLRYLLDLDPPEIADLLKVPLGTVSSRLARGLADLRSALEVRST